MTSTHQHARRGRRTVARHGELSSPGPVAFVLKVVAVVVAVVLASGAGVAAYAAYDLTASFAEGAVDLEGQEALPPPTMGAIEGEANFFLAGTDACEPEYEHLFGKRCTGPDAGGELNDVNLLVHISDNPRRVTAISFPRDLMVPIPECTREDGSTTSAMSEQPLNSAYSVGGLSCVASTVSQLSGLNIQYAAKITWGGVIELTEAVGGVEVCLAAGIRDRETGIDWPAGTREIAGVEALQFLRTRYGVGDGSDLGRVSNQQVYMSSLARKVMSEEVLTNVGTLYKLATTAVDNITPSQSLTNPVRLAQLALAVKDVPLDEIVFVQYPSLPDPNDSNKVVPNEEAAQQLWDALAANQPIQLTGDVAANDGVVLADPPAAETPAETPATPAPEASEPATPAPTETAVELPSTITGSNASQTTCSNGNLRGRG
ncbi:LCP family protein [Microbacterium sp. M3]|uniref:LCP family protein n=1 Tax=Microbacterium arthrosphaerae TaxID=792652 RepID=A0ABU4GY17_9MICO|nr:MULTISPECIES: LCP family protein [Microbacterium]MDW4571977.1 LCP family protein [Microbacterium arthrosphaerae]MDW7605832.1 LCP family protein [Microbacterium sp. M3]